MATPTASLPTRQQLDEIDALLKRMLTLPPLPGETPEAMLPAESSPMAASSYPAPTIREVPPPSAPVPGEPIVHEWRVEWSQPPAQQPPPVVAWGAPVSSPPPAVHQPRFDPNPPYTPPNYAVAIPAVDQVPFAMAVPYVPGQPPPSSVKPPAAMPVQALLLLNGTFNVLTYLLGPLGTWLRGSGRNTLGWCGMLMLVAAAVWAAGEWYGFDWSRIDTSKLGLPSTGAR